MNYPFTIKLLNKNDPHEIEALERALFNSFKNSKDRSLEAIWDFNDSEQRIKIQIPYNDIEIMVALFDGSIVSGTAVNFNMSGRLQLEYFGFSIDKSEPGICEGLYLFNTYSDLNDLFFLLSTFRKHLYEFLISRNVRKVYATCSRRRLRNYRFLGFKDIDMKLVNEHLLAMDI
jgi:hypothetical protein